MATVSISIAFCRVYFTLFYISGWVLYLEERLVQTIFKRKRHTVTFFDQKVISASVVQKSRRNVHIIPEMPIERQEKKHKDLHLKLHLSIFLHEQSVKLLCVLLK